MKSYLLPILAFVCVLAAAGWTYSVRPTHEATKPVAPPPQSNSQITVAGVGLVEPESENIELSCSASGMVTGVFVRAGDHVRKGQALFSVDDRELAADLAVRRAALQAARARLRKLQEVPRAEEIPPAEAKVAEAEAGVADARVQVQLIESVTDPRAVKREDIERRRVNYQAAQARLDGAKRDLALLKAGTWGPDLDIARADVAQAEAAERQDEMNLERLTTEAPIAGTILQSRVRVGQYAQCGPLASPLMVFGADGELHLRVDVDENDAWRVQPNRPASAYLRGNSRVSFPLDFVRFEPYVIPKKSLTGDATERVDTRVLEVIYRFKTSNPAVFDGQQMDVYIETDSVMAGRPTAGVAKGAP